MKGYGFSAGRARFCRGCCFSEAISDLGIATMRRVKSLNRANRSLGGLVGFRSFLLAAPLALLVMPFDRLGSDT